MTPFDRLINALETFEDNEQEIVLDLVQKFEKQILDMNREQLWKGARADWSDIRPKYRPFTVKMKKFKGQPFQRVTLKDTGAFYADLYIDYGPDYFKIWSEDEKTQKLVSKYGSGIFGLSDNDILRLTKIFRPLLIKQLKELING